VVMFPLQIVPSLRSDFLVLLLNVARSAAAQCGRPCGPRKRPGSSWAGPPDASAASKAHSTAEALRQCFMSREFHLPRNPPLILPNLDVLIAKACASPNGCGSIIPRLENQSRRSHMPVLVAPVTLAIELSLQLQWRLAAFHLAACKGGGINI